MDYTQSAEKVLVDHINAANVATELALTPQQVSFVTPFTVSEHGVVTLVVAAVPNKGYTGSETVTYSRLQLGLRADGDVELSLPVDATWADLIAAANAALDINLVIDKDVASDTFPDWPEDEEEDLTLVIPALSTSLVYAGSFQVVITQDRTALSDAIVVTDLGNMT